jgi:hypothetical protein
VHIAHLRHSISIRLIKVIPNFNFKFNKFELFGDQIKIQQEPLELFQSDTYKIWIVEWYFMLL